MGNCWGHGGEGRLEVGLKMLKTLYFNAKMNSQKKVYYEQLQGENGGKGEGMVMGYCRLEAVEMPRIWVDSPRLEVILKM